MYTLTSRSYHKPSALCVCAKLHIANTYDFLCVCVRVCVHTKDQWYENAASFKENTTQRLVTSKNNPVRCSFVFSAGHHQPYLAAI